MHLSYSLEAILYWSFVDVALFSVNYRYPNVNTTMVWFRLLCSFLAEQE